ncbi:MAG: helix-turn-helix domain-containing protein [Flavobacteriales bacterium]|jgi:excisionase family DNA binding protein|nr:helix-turn-helix domain-containing protein [Flavobacteriales bacterium]
MEKTNITISKEELQQLIEDAIYKATCTQPNLEYNIITEKELSKRLGITKVTLHKYRKQGKIPFSQVGRTIRYDYKEVMETLKHKQ